MKYIVTILIAIATYIGAYNYLPLDWISWNQGVQKVGSTITTILGTDTLSASRSVINTNFSNLNTDKIESTYSGSLSNVTGVGTLTSGSLGSGFTTVVVGRGGTGLATLTSGALLYGNGTGNVSLLGPCSDQQVPIYVSSVPTCGTSAVDTTANFNWTGTNRFKTLIASSTLTISNGGAGYSLTFPSTVPPASTTPIFAPSGVILYENEGWSLIASTTLSAAVSSTTLSWSGIADPTRVHLRIYIMAPTFNGAAGQFRVQFNSDTTGNYTYKTTTDGGASTGNDGQTLFCLTDCVGATFNVGNNQFSILDIINLQNYKKFITSQTNLGDTAGGTLFNSSSVGGWVNTTAQITSITVGAGDTNSAESLGIGTTIHVYGSKY